MAGEEPVKRLNGRLFGLNETGLSGRKGNPTRQQRVLLFFFELDPG